jgi:predicted Zn-dependent protease
MMKQPLALALSLSVAVSGCATNPATGRRQISLVGEGSEINMGKEADQQVAAQLGLYDDESLQRYVSDIGMRLAKASERPELPWQFRVLDDPSVNALALPGGYVYITRGMLAHMTSEAQLAGVLGHEIGHVTARHAVVRMSKAQVANIGLLAGMIIRPDLQQLGQLASGGLELLFLKYSRDDENQADELGVRYMTRADYDPSTLPDVFRTLQKLGEAESRGKVPGWLSTHPDPGNRAQRIAQMVQALPAADREGQVEQDAYMNRMDGMVYGADPREGYFEANAFYHPTLRFQLEFPRGWRTNNGKQQVAAMSPSQDALVALTMGRARDPESAARQFFSQQNVRQGRAQRTQIGGREAVMSEFQAQGQQGVLQGLVAFVEDDGKVYQLMGYSPVSRWRQYAGIVEQSITSFDELRDERRMEVEPARIEVVNLDRPLSVAQLDQRFSGSVPERTLALINQVEPASELRGTVKVVVGGPPQPEERPTRSSTRR